MTEEQITISSDFMLDINGRIPYYYQLKQFIIEQIESGEWHSGQMLPYENQLCQHFNISRTVIRQTLQELKNDGYIVTRKGKGTYIAEPEINENITQNLVGFYETWTSMGLEVENVVLGLEKNKPSEEIRNALKLNKDDEVIVLQRLSKLNNKPYSLSINYIPYEPLKKLLYEDFRFTGLYTLLEKKYKMELTHGQSTIQIALATKEEAELLNIKKRDPLFLLEGISFLKNDKPMVFYHTVHIGERSKIRVEIRKNRTFSKAENMYSDTPVPSLLKENIKK
ncbi:MAG: GntR family transcriptional regulator [Candidatus Humimicrobiaceae bacterium]